MAMKKWSSRFYYDDDADEYRVSIDIDFEEEEQCAEFGIEAMKDAALREAIEALAERTGGIWDPKDNIVTWAKDNPERAERVEQAARSINEALGVDPAVEEKARVEKLDAARADFSPWDKQTVVILGDGVEGAATVYLFGVENGGYYDIDVEVWDPQDKENNHARFDTRAGIGCSMYQLAQAIAFELQYRSGHNFGVNVDYLAAQLKYWNDFRQCRRVEAGFSGEAAERWREKAHFKHMWEFSVFGDESMGEVDIEIIEDGGALEYCVKGHASVMDPETGEAVDSSEEHMVRVDLKLPLATPAEQVAKEIADAFAAGAAAKNLGDGFNVNASEVEEEIRAWLEKSK